MKINLTSRFASILFFAVLTNQAQASDSQVGTLTQVEGDVKVFTHPSKTIQKDGATTDGSHVLYEGEYYLVQVAQTGDKVDQGNIVRTAPNAKTRVVFENGDQFNVGPATAYRVFWGKEFSQGGTQVNLMYGKLRGIIEKGGPRSRLQVRTKSAVMGVRGTDFFIASNGTDNTTEVSILRGKVEVTPQVAPNTPRDQSRTRPIEVNAGMSAEIAARVPVAMKAANTASAPKKVEPQIELRQTTQEDLVGIQKSSQIAQPAAPVSKEMTAEIKKLESKAVENTLKDIKNSDKKLFAELEKNHVTSMEDLNSKSVQNIQKDAPKAPEKRKLYKSEVDDLENGAYEKYFKYVE